MNDIVNKGLSQTNLPKNTQSNSIAGLKEQAEPLKGQSSNHMTNTLQTNLPNTQTNLK